MSHEEAVKTFWEMVAFFGAVGVAVLTIAAALSVAAPLGGSPEWERAAIFLFVAVGVGVLAALGALTAKALP
jgi:predicted membrane channel-forming protein YqfA (hemolysin III family)